VNKDTRRITLTSQYAWLYNQAPYSNDPNGDLLHPDEWITECACVPAATTPAPVITRPFRPNHAYDEQRVLLGRSYPAGTAVRLTVPATSTAASTVIDLLDSEQVGLPSVDLRAVNVWLFGADPLGRRDAAGAFDKAIATAKALRLPVYVPPGLYALGRHVVVDGVTIEGAGSWWTILRGNGAGFSARPGGSSNVRLSGLAIEGDVRGPTGSDQADGISGVLRDSTIDGLYIHHTRTGIALGGPATGVRITDTQIADQLAGGIRLAGGVSGSRLADVFIRNTGDDGIALSSTGAGNAGDTVDHATVQTPVVGNGIALHGGTDTTLSNNLVADPVRAGTGVQLASAPGTQPFAGHVWETGNTLVRAAPFDLDARIGLGAFWVHAIAGSIGADVEVRGDAYLDSTYNAMLLLTDFGVKDEFAITNVHVQDVRIDGTGTSVLSARTAGSASFANVDARNVGAVGINNCGSFHFTPNGSEFSIADLGGNDGGGPSGPWMATWALPNTITCDDRPPVVAPPAPSPW
jgi:hypothetical protein